MVEDAREAIVAGCYGYGETNVEASGGECLEVVLIILDRFDAVPLLKHG
jgi:hypothetical protein